MQQHSKKVDCQLCVMSSCNVTHYIIRLKKHRGGPTRVRLPTIASNVAQCRGNSYPARHEKRERVTILATTITSRDHNCLGDEFFEATEPLRIIYQTLEGTSTFEVAKLSKGWKLLNNIVRRGGQSRTPRRKLYSRSKIFPSDKIIQEAESISKLRLLKL